MWKPYGTRRTVLKPVDPISLVNSAVRERMAKDGNNGVRVKPVSTISATTEQRLKISNKTFTLNQLVLDLSKDDYSLRIIALRELPGLIENPLYADVAIEMKIVEKLALLQKRYGKKLLTVRANEETLILNLLYTLSTYLKAAKQMASEHYLIGSLYKMIRTLHGEQHVAATILKNLSEKPESLEILMKVPRILRLIAPILQRELCTTYYPKDLWDHLQHVLDYNPVKGVQENFLDAFLHRIKFKIADFHLDNMKCLSILLKTTQGKSQFQAFDGVQIFYDLLKPKAETLSDYRPLLEAFKNVLFNNPSLVEECAKFKDFSEILIKMAKNTEDEKVQLYCFYILNYLNSREEIRKNTAKSFRKILLATKALSKESEYYKLALKCCLYRSDNMTLEVSGILKN